jgi:hypothetical protein
MRYFYMVIFIPPKPILRLYSSGYSNIKFTSMRSSTSPWRMALKVSSASSRRRRHFFLQLSLILQGEDPADAQIDVRQVDILVGCP